MDDEFDAADWASVWTNQPGWSKTWYRKLTDDSLENHSVSESHDNSTKVDVDDYDDVDCYINPVKETNKSQSDSRSLVFASENQNTILTEFF